MSAASELLKEYGGLVLGAYGAIVSTLIALKQNRARLIVRASAAKPGDLLAIEIFNPSGRKSVIKAAVIQYGPTAGGSHPIHEFEDLSETLLEPGQGVSRHLGVDHLQKASASKGIQPTMYARIWLIVQAYGGRRYASPVEIDPELDPQPRDARAKPFILADLVMGFPIRIRSVTDYSRMK